MSEESNKRIAKNTLMLYVRHLVTLFVSMYTVRVVLEVLGVVDYGIYGVVGGVVAMFAFLSNSMATASQRYFAFHIGNNDTIKLKETFSVTFLIYIGVILFVLAISQTFGLWFVNTKMTIPIERINAANWVYQFSVFTFILSIIVIPYNALIMAREKMSVFAWIGIIEVLLKLIVVFLLVKIAGDKLKLYAVLMFLLALLVSLFYVVYCYSKYEESKFRFIWNKKLFKELALFSGWNLFGALAGVFNGQGVNILLNIFFGPILNTARGIAFQVGSSVNSFVLNFMNAARPQITKLFAANESDKMLSLVYRSSKFSFFMLFILCLPILIETEIILRTWLKVVPEYTVIFTRLILVSALVDSISYSLQTVAQATGRIKFYQMIVGGTMILNLPVVYFFLKIGSNPETVFYLAIINSIVSLFLRLIILKYMVKFSIVEFIKNVLLPITQVTLLACLSLLAVYTLFENNNFRFLIVFVAALFLNTLSIYFYGITKSEKLFLWRFIKSKR